MWRTATVLLAVCLFPSSAYAGPPAPRGIEIGARVAANVNDQGLLALAGLRVGGRVVPHLGLGAYVDVTPYFSPITPKCGGCEPSPERPFRFGGYLDVHLRPTHVVDPWLRVALGFVRTARSSADAEFAFGLDIRQHHVAFGPFVMWIVPMAEGQPTKWVGAGAQLSVAF